MSEIPLFLGLLPMWKRRPNGMVTTGIVGRVAGDARAIESRMELCTFSEEVGHCWGVGGAGKRVDGKGGGLSSPFSDQPRYAQTEKGEKTTVVRQAPSASVWDGGTTINGGLRFDDGRDTTTSHGTPSPSPSYGR